jgi:hypothetical protein
VISILAKNDNFLVSSILSMTGTASPRRNAAGAQWDGTLHEGGKVDLSWDNKWYSGKTFDDRWP